ncbi:MAG: hypothetical protein MSR29_07065 [Lachnospiraceae bacterium]|nr:hypothetical protein [Lachnospiraceae bacterium]
MDREEFQIKLDEINSLVSRKEYKAALEIVNSIDWRRVKNVRTLCMVGEIYAVNKKYSESREIFLLAYHRSQVGKTILYRLVEVSLKMKDFKEAQEYYEEFVRIAPKDNIRYILQYKIAAAKNVPLEKQIQILEKHKEKEMTERWSYELAKLYYKADNYQKCIEACDDLVIWFRDGKYVIRALELKMKLTELTPSQQEIYEENLRPPVQEKEKTAESTTQEKKEAVVRDEKPQKIEISVQKDKPKKRKFKKAEAPAEEAIPKTEEAIDWEAILKKGESEKEQVVAEEAAPEETAPEKTETPDWEAILKKGESETEENSNEEEASIGDERNFQKKITAGIRDIFKRHFKPAEEDIYKPEEELKVMYTAGKINYSDVIPERVLPDDVPALEPEIIREEPIVESVAQPKKVEEVPELEPEVMKEEPVAELEAEIIEEEPAAEPETEIVEEEPVAEPETEIVEEEPIEEPETEIVEEEPIEEPEAEIVEEEPVEEPETEIIEEEPAEEPEDIEKPVEETQVIPEIPKLNIPKVNVNETAKVEDLSIEDKLSFNLEDTILAAAAKQGIPVPEKSSEEVEPEPEDEAEELMEQPVEVYVEETIEEELPEEETVEEIIEEELPEEETVEETIEEELSEEETVEEIIEEQLPEEEIVEEIIEEELPEEETIQAQPELEPEPEFSEEEALLRFIDEHSSGANAKNRELIPREAVLDDEEQKLFKYFSSIPGMEKQLVDVLIDTQMAAADFTSSTGNVIIMGNRESGKTTLSELLVKAICRELKIPAAKIAKVTAQQLNGKDIGKIVAQLSGGFLLIQDMNQMDAETVEALNQAMETPTEGLTVIIEDEKIGMRKFIARNPKLIEKFTSRIAIPVFTNDELVNFAKIYTNEAGYKIDEMGILALYSLISDNQKEDEPMTVGGVKRLVDDAISKAESGTRKLQRNLSKSRLDRDGFVILYEKDFK